MIVLVRDRPFAVARVSGETPLATAMDQKLSPEVTVWAEAPAAGPSAANTAAAARAAEPRRRSGWLGIPGGSPPPDGLLRPHDPAQLRPSALAELLFGRRRRVLRRLETDVDGLEALVALAAGVGRVGLLVGLRQADAVGERREQGPGPQSADGDDVDLGGHDDDQREQVDPGDEAEDQAEDAVGLRRALQRVGDHIGAENLHQGPQDAGRHRADA